MPRYQSNPDAGATLIVNLFLLLLAFFIVLVALSEIVEERSEQAIDSIAEVFSVTIDATENINNDPQYRASGISNDFIIDTIRTIVESKIKAVEPTVIEQNSNQLFVRYNLVDLFQSNAAIIRPDKRIVIRRIADSIAKAPDPIYTLVTVTSPIADFSSSFTFGIPLAAKRAEHLIDLLDNEGVPDYYLQAGITNAGEDYVEFSFFIDKDHFPNIKIIPKDFQQ